jgi:hypothetical protein
LLEAGLIQDLLASGFGSWWKFAIELDVPLREGVASKDTVRFLLVARSTRIADGSGSHADLSSVCVSETLCREEADAAYTLRKK